MKVPHYQRGAVSLVERQLTLHRERYNELRSRMDEIIDIAHRNDYLANLLHDLSVGLMAADSLVDVFAFLQEMIADELGCEHWSAHLCDNEVVACCAGGLPSQVTLIEEGYRIAMPDQRATKTVYCGPASPERVARFFADVDAEIRSLAIIKLYRSQDFGYLALGSETRERFAPHMGTEFLARFGLLVSARLAVFYD